MDLIDAVVEGDDRPYFTCEHEEHLLVAVTHTHTHTHIHTFI